MEAPPDPKLFWQYVAAAGLGIVALSGAVGAALALFNHARGGFRRAEAIEALPEALKKLDSLDQKVDRLGTKFDAHEIADNERFAQMKTAVDAASGHMTTVVSQLETSLEQLDRAVIRLDERAQVTREFNERQHPGRRRDDRG